MNDYSNKAKVDHYLRKSDGPVDCSGYEPPGEMKTEEQTSACKPKPRAFKRGGAVGEASHKTAARKSRAVGGANVPQNVGAATNVGNLVPSQMFNFSNPTRNSGMYGAKKGGCVKKASGGDANNDADDRQAKAKGGKADHWIAGAIKHPGALHKELGVPEGKKIPEKKLEKAEHSKNPVERKRANLAETLKGMHKAKGGEVEERTERAHGGRTKGKTNVNIIIATGERKPMAGPTAPPMALGAPMAAPPPPPGVGPTPQAPPPMAGAPPAMGPRPPMPGGVPMRAEGGRLIEPGYPKAMEPGKGSGGGQGRMIKAKEYGV